MFKTAGIIFLFLMPFAAIWFAANGYTQTGLILHGLSLIVFIAAAGIFGLRVLLSLFKQDHETAVKAVVGMVVALGMVLLTALLMVASNPGDRTKSIDNQVVPVDSLR